MRPFLLRALCNKRSRNIRSAMLLEGEALWWKRYCAALEIKIRHH